MPGGLMERKNSIFPSVNPADPHPRKPIPWSAAPLLLPVVGLGAGILFSAALDYGYRTHFALATVACCLPVVFFSLRPAPKSIVSTATTACLLLATLCFGAWYAGARHLPNDARYFGKQLAEGALTIGSVEATRPAGSRIAATLEVEGLLADGLLRPATGKVLAYLEGGEELAVGDRVVVSPLPRPVPPPLNPGVFDYAAYLAGQSIYHRVYADAEEWKRLPAPAAWSIAALGARSRDAWFASLEPYLSGDDLAVAAALIMGKRDLLGTELRSAYADTGAIHVLAVSGLHVGILALIVMQVLGWLLPARPLWFGVRSAVTIAVVGYFAVITGLSPSVQRAALMVTVVLLGKSLRRSNSIYNLLAISALLMLAIEPKQLFQVGFQLSFAAVVGIALFARSLQRLVHLPGKLHYLWDAVSVSTAAQLGTVPFSLYYFGQFPVYFLLSGTLVIVFAYLVLGLGLLHGFLALIGVTGNWLYPTSYLLNGTVGLQNAFIRACRALPGATLELTSFGLLSALGLGLLIVTLAYLSYRPSHRARWVAMGLIGALAAYWLLSPILYPPPRQFTIYHLPRLTLIDVFTGEVGSAIGDTVPPETLDYQVNPSRRPLGTAFGALLPFDRDTSASAAAVAYPLLRLLDRRVLVLDGTRDYPQEAWPETDLVLVRKGFRPAAVPAELAAYPMVVDGSNPPYLADDWKEAFPGVHITAEDGAYRYVE